MKPARATGTAGAALGGEDTRATLAQTRRPRLRQIPRDQLAHRNILCREREAWPLGWLGHDWQASIGTQIVAGGGSLQLVFDWGGATLGLWLDATQAAWLCGLALGDSQLDELPDELLAPLIEHVLGELAARIERVTRKHLHLVSVTRSAGEHAPPAPSELDLGWTLRQVASDDAPARPVPVQLDGRMRLDADAQRYLAALLRADPHAGASASSASAVAWDALPIPVRLCIGWVDVGASALRALGVRDVLLLDECHIDAQSRLVVHLGGGLGFHADLDGARIRVTQGVQSIMSHTSDDLPGDAGAGLLDDIPVRLSFDVGERVIPLGELRALQAGSLFNLGRDPRSTVTIRANGRVLGEGELVDIEGRIGVAVLRLSAPGGDSAAPADGEPA